MSNNNTRKKTLLDIQAEQQEQRERSTQSNNSRGTGGSRPGDAFRGGAFRGGGGNRAYSPGPGGRNGRSGGGFRGEGQGGGGGRGGRNRGQRQKNFSHLPLEQGAICSLKDSFGFIRAAERPEEIFFHFSEVRGCHPADLNLDDEIEFYVGNSASRAGENERLAAFQIKRLEPGTVQWEIEEEPGKRYRGLVERSVSMDHRDRGFSQSSKKSTMEGTIRILVETKQTKAKDKGGDNDAPKEMVGHVTATATGPLVRYKAVDYSSSSGQQQATEQDGEKPPREQKQRRPARLSRGDLVEFNLFVERRSQIKYARSVTLLLSERDRARQEAEKRMLAEATLEQGVVTALKGEYGFIRSNKRREAVYFHYSNIELEGDDENGDLMLKEGQEMQFLVVKEGKESSGRSPRISARRVKMQPRGSVKFHDVIAEGCKGVVSICPQPADTSHSLEQAGKVLLSQPLTVVEVNRDGEEEEKVITEVVMLSRDAPGGSFDYRGETSIGLWIQQGDTLLFDVVKDLVDGVCRAAPTRHLVPREHPEQPIEENKDNGQAADDANPNEDEKYNGDEGEDDYTPPRVRLIRLSLAGRAEGIVKTLKDNFGFLQYAERPVDVHFKTHQVLPDFIQDDVRRNMGLANTDDKGNPLSLQVDCEVQFDLSVHGTIVHSKYSTQVPKQRGGRGAGGRGKDPVENLKAQRILFLPPKTVAQKMEIALDVKGVVTKEDPKQNYAGSIELETALRSQSLESRHPLVAKLIDCYIAATDQKFPIVFPDIQSKKDDDVVIEMLELKAKDQLSWMHIPVPGEHNYEGRLCIRKIESNDIVETSEPVHEDGEPAEAVEVNGVEAVNSNGVEQSLVSAKSMGKKRSKNKPKSIKNLRYDKSCLVPELKEDEPPGIDDTVRFDVVQSRRTGQITIENLRITERYVRGVISETSGGEGVGVVKDITRNFGFISVLDETDSREMLFFNLSNVVDPSAAADDHEASEKSVAQIRKGDEVKFDIGTEKNGKRVGFNVTVLPKGSVVSSKPDKNACLGYILLGPAHTTLKNTPSRKLSANSQKYEKTGRWGNVDEDRKKCSEKEPVTELGCILLLEDPSNMFGHKSDTLKTPTEVREEPSSLKPEGGAEDSCKEDSNNIQNQVVASSCAKSSQPSTKCHLRYKKGGIAMYGTGSSAEDSTNPRRGDLVSFVKVKNGAGVRDIRIVKRGGATLVRGRLQNIECNTNVGDATTGLAKFVAATGGEEYEVDLAEVVGCDPTVLKNNESVEGVLHEGSIYGVCRTADLYLESKLGDNRQERPKLNLTVKKDRGGTIMAQSMMAKGPDGTTGFPSGWTTRKSQYATLSTTLQIEAEPFVPQEFKEDKIDVSDAEEKTATNTAD